MDRGAWLALVHKVLKNQTWLKWLSTHTSEEVIVNIKLMYVKHSEHHLVSISSLIIHWKDWCWSWNSNTLATWGEELTHLKRPWCWERLKAGGEGDDRGWDGWMASLTQCTRVWTSSGSWWWTGKPGVLQSTGSQSQARLSEWTELTEVLTTAVIII